MLSGTVIAIREVILYKVKSISQYSMLFYRDLYYTWTLMQLLHSYCPSVGVMVVCRAERMSVCVCAMSVSVCVHSLYWWLVGRGFLSMSSFWWTCGPMGTGQAGGKLDGCCLRLFSQLCWGNRMWKCPSERGGGSWWPSVLSWTLCSLFRSVSVQWKNNTQVQLSIKLISSFSLMSFFLSTANFDSRWKSWCVNIAQKFWGLLLVIQQWNLSFIHSCPWCCAGKFVYWNWTFGSAEQCCCRTAQGKVWP